MESGSLSMDMNPVSQLAVYVGIFSNGKLQAPAWPFAMPCVYREKILCDRTWKRTSSLAEARQGYSLDANGQFPPRDLVERYLFSSPGGWSLITNGSAASLPDDAKMVCS